MNFYPDFLSGTTAKIEEYDQGTYYPTIFKHFEENLKTSKNLIIIGYGFGDSKINFYIENVFLSDVDKKIFIVDIKKPKSQLLSRESVYFIEGGVVGMNIEFIKNHLSK